MENKVITIDLADHGGPVYSGRPRGESLRERFALDKLDVDDKAKIVLLVPDNTYSVTSSFFLGMFGPSITKAGSIPMFKEKVEIRAPRSISERLESFMHRALQRKSLFGFDHRGG